MIFQWVLVGLCLAAAAAYLVRHFWMAWRGKGTGCGCGDCPAKTPQDTAGPRAH